MNYTKSISEKIDFLNVILDELNVLHILENPDFIVDKMSMESWLKINLNVKVGNKIPICFTITQFGLEIGLDRIPEALDWSNKDLTESKTIVKSILKNILTNHIFIEYFGSNYTQISIFGKDGKCTNCFKYTNGIPFKWKRKTILYFPVYPALRV